MDNTVWNLEGHDESEPLHFTACGLDNVLLGSGYDVVDTPEGRGVRIRNLDELTAQLVSSWSPIRRL